MSRSMNRSKCYSLHAQLVLFTHTAIVLTVPTKLMYLTQQEFQHRCQIVHDHIKFIVVSKVYVLYVCNLRLQT
jgi:hypothetical protein